jgi:hypothetical protein
MESTDARPSGEALTLFRRAGLSVVWVAGGVLAGVFGVAAALRRARGLHPLGVVGRGTLELTGDERAPAAAELGSPATLDVVVRVSRAAGLPSPWPDVGGLAVRWVDDGRPQNLLLASTGLGRLSRYLPHPRRRPLAGPLTTLLPLRGAHGPVVLAVRPAGFPVLELLAATPLGRWHPIGRLTLELREEDDASVRFDPTTHPPGSLGTYRWEDLLRERAYAASRRWGGRPA